MIESAKILQNEVRNWRGLADLHFVVLETKVSLMTCTPAKNRLQGYQCIPPPAQIQTPVFLCNAIQACAFCPNE